MDCLASAQPMTLTLKGAHSLMCKLVFADSWVPMGQGSFGGGGSPASSREAVSTGGIPTGPSVVRCLVPGRSGKDGHKGRMGSRRPQGVCGGRQGEMEGMLGWVLCVPHEDGEGDVASVLARQTFLRLSVVWASGRE